MKINLSFVLFLSFFCIFLQTNNAQLISLSYSENPATYFLDTPITPNIPMLENDSDTNSWSISPSLPSGLTFNTSTGIITGTPTSVTNTTTYQVIAILFDESMGMVELVITVLEGGPSATDEALAIAIPLGVLGIFFVVALLFILYYRSGEGGFFSFFSSPFSTSYSDGYFRYERRNPRARGTKEYYGLSESF